LLLPHSRQARIRARNDDVGPIAPDAARSGANDGRDGYGNLHERVAMLVFDDHSVNVIFVDQFADLPDEFVVFPVNLFDYVVEVHAIE
jgi:hypothetical protein